MCLKALLRHLRNKHHQWGGLHCPISAAKEAQAGCGGKVRVRGCRDGSRVVEGQGEVFLGEKNGRMGEEPAKASSAKSYPLFWVRSPT